MGWVPSELVAQSAVMRAMFNWRMSRTRICFVHDAISAVIVSYFASSTVLAGSQSPCNVESELTHTSSLWPGLILHHM